MIEGCTAFCASRVFSQISAVAYEVFSSFLLKSTKAEMKKQIIATAFYIRALQ